MRNVILYSLLVFNIACGGAAKKNTAEKDMSKLSKKYTKEIQFVNATHRTNLNQMLCPSEVKTIKNKKWTQLLDYANACVNKKQWKMLEVIARKLTEKTSFSPWGAYYLSLVAEAQNQMDRAFWLVDLALKKAPQMGILYYQKARLQWKNKEYELSVQSFEKSIELKVNIVEPHLFLAKVHFRDQDLKMAEYHFSKVLDKDAREFTALVGMAKIAKIKGDADAELNFLQRASKVRPQDKWVKSELSKLIKDSLPRDVASRNKAKEGGDK
ncbi:MAG: hypothetical protein KDD40_08565 [Bdellovibrionales bacterium]|nr:hypothetical protein [Bdellovibrionales bacterium]